jgi:hypothetical protein
MPTDWVLISAAGPAARIDRGCGSTAGAAAVRGCRPRDRTGHAVLSVPSGLVGLDGVDGLLDVVEVNGCSARIGHWWGLSLATTGDFHIATAEWGRHHARWEECASSRR